MTERDTLAKLAETTRFLERTVANLSEAVLVVGDAGERVSGLDPISKPASRPPPARRVR
jgi:hypothetical protein